MADAAVGATVQVLLETIISLAADRIGLSFGFKDELENLKESAAAIQAVLADAEAKQRQEEQVKLWLKRLEGVAFEADNAFDELNYQLLRRQVKSRNRQQQQLKGKVCFFFSFSYTKFAFRWRMASKIRDINTKLKKINQEATEFGLSIRYQIEAALPVPATAGYTTSRHTDSIVVPNVVGRANDESKIVEILLNPSDKVVSVIPIVGMGGLGKTTLAKSVYNNPKIIGHFGKKIWVCVSEISVGMDIFKLILESLTRKKVELSGKDAVVQEIRKELQQDKYFVVLDDVWNQDQILWDDFFNTLKGLNATNGSWCLVTTRLEEVANIMSSHLKMNFGLYKLGNLTDDECWSIIKEKVITGEEVPDELEAIKKQILGRCNGLPLAATLIGSWLLMNKKEEWLSFVQKSLLDDQNGVEQIIKVSFDHLSPASVKKCFAYCSIFSQDSQLKKDQLIELWMAEGFLQPDPKNEILMEDKGDKYFRMLLQSSLLEEVKEWGSTCYKMHDLVHDFAKSTLNQDQYLVLNSTKSMAEDILKKNSTSLRTLFLKSSISDDVLYKFECLHVLKLSGKDVKVLPASIGELIHLRVLDISNSKIKILPKSLCNLYNLQTLRIKDSILEEGLPKQMSDLIRLRHLHYYDAQAEFQMPSEMGQLTHLQTLKFFNVGQEDCRGIEELGTLKNLKGSLEIRNLELVNGKEGAEGARLIEKPNISELKLFWGRMDRESNRCDQNVLQGLQPHPNLQKLEIQYFMGDRLPQWFMNLSTLTLLVLRDCKLIEIPPLGRMESLQRLELNGLELRELPAVGQMPSLRFLYLERMRHIRTIGLSFYGVIDDNKGKGRKGSGSTGNSCGQVVMSRKFFPALQYLTMRQMKNLVEWKDADEMRSITRAAEIDLFPMLETLSIDHCSQLTSAPSHFPSIKKLGISGTFQVSLLEKILSSITTLSSLELSGGHSIRSLDLSMSRLILKGCDGLPSKMLESLYHLPSLQYLRLENFLDLTSIRLACETCHLKLTDCENSGMPEDLHDLECQRINPGQKCLQSLEKLSIYHCSFTSLSVEMLESWTSLRRLELNDCPYLISFPLDLQKTPSLKVLKLFGCPKLMTNDMPEGFAFLTSLKFLHIGPFSDNSSVHRFDWSGLVSSSSFTLKSLVLCGLPHIDFLPHQLQHLTSLTCLHLFEFGIEALPDWIGNLASLEKLGLRYCEKLQNLPSMAAMRRLTKLTSLEVWRCPLLEERCNHQSSTDSEWLKISHIPNLEFH